MFGAPLFLGEQNCDIYCLFYQINALEAKKYLCFFDNLMKILRHGKSRLRPDDVTNLTILTFCRSNLDLFQSGAIFVHPGLRIFSFRLKFSLKFKIQEDWKPK